MTFEAAKTFDRDGVRYRPGDPLPSDLDKQTLDHYKRHGMVRPASRAPAEKKPATPKTPVRTPRQNKVPLPVATQTKAPDSVGSGVVSGPADESASTGPADASGGLPDALPAPGATNADASLDTSTAQG